MSSASAERFEQALSAAAHLLPAQGPIGVFVHHNTLHAFQHKPFLEAVEEAARIHRAEPYLSSERFRAEAAAGRILARDLEAELQAELLRLELDPAHELAPGLSRAACWELLLRYPLEPLSGQPLRWLLSEGGRSRRLRPDLEPATRTHLLGETRAWFEALPEGERLSALTGASGSAGALALRRALGVSPQGLAQLPWRDPEGLAAACLQVASQALVAQASPQEPTVPATPPRPRDRLLALGCEDPDELVHPFLIRWLGAFLDQGSAYWPLEGREGGLFSTLTEAWTQPGCLLEPWQRGLTQALTAWRERQVAASLLATEELERLGLEPERWEQALQATLLALPGWTGMVHVLEERPDLAPHHAPPLDLVELVALRLLLDRHAAEHTAAAAGLGRSLRELSAPPPPAPDPAAQAWVLRELAELAGLAAPALLELGQERVAALFAELELCSDVTRRRIWHLAYERTHRDAVLGATQAHWREASAASLPPPRIQAVFCIDEREESLRRQLEEIGPQFETLGAAGFYGLAIDYVGLDEHRGAPLCPAALRASHSIREHPLEHPAHGPRRQRRRLLGKAQHGLRVASRHVTGGLTSTLGFGLLSAFPLVSATLFPRWTARVSERLSLAHKPPTYLSALRAEDEEPTDGLPVGFTVPEAAQRVGQLLGDMGLRREFAPLVAVFGHGSQSLNNPHESAHDCGACSGRHGGPNARLFAALANDPEVRALLRTEHRVEIPDGTWFVGGFHDTCTCGVTYYDLELVPDSHQGVLAELLEGMERARTLSAHERCRRFERAPLNLTPREALHHVEARATHLAEPRPEYGHASNALCYVGRRKWSRGLFLDRRAFLVSYDPTQDESLEILTRLLTSVGPVGAGISLEYYFSYVDNERYGCGTKLPHNVSSLLGVMNGHQSDLRTGLPWQMVEIHEPVRLLTLVEATPEALLEVASRSPGVAELVGGGWINLVSIHPETGAMQLFSQGGFVPYLPPPVSLAAAPTSADYYTGRRDHLPPARIAAALEIA